MLGVTIVVQGKIGNLDRAIEDAKETINQGLADICFAAAYPRELTEVSDIAELKKTLETATKLEIAIVKPPTQFSIEGCPSNSIRKLGAVTVSELLTLFQGGIIYDEIVGQETAELIADKVGRSLDIVKGLSKESAESIRSRMNSLSGIVLEAEKVGKDEAEETG
ncbi:MAG: hypothetical protein QXJ09_07825 [Candidatus Caldarchaeum sp.]